MITNCVNCGAPIESDKKVCPYCKTPYDASGFKAEIGEVFGEITIGGRTCDADGTLHRGNPKTLRKFTLIEV